MMNRAYAVAKNGEIDARTVGPTERSAKVNWLVTTAGIMVGAHWTDEAIDFAWKEARGAHDLVAIDMRIVAVR